MRAVHSDRAFKVLIGAGATLALLFGTAVYRAILAGCPNGGGKIDFACLFLPTHTDLGTHLISYAFMGMIFLGVSFSLVLWCRQWTKMRLLNKNLVVLHVSDSRLGPLTWRLGLKDKVRLLDSKVPLCFCAGFISPHVYLSRGMVAKLTPEELDALLLHEKHHMENHDPLKILLGKLVVSSFFFIPALRDVFKRYLIEKEIAADKSAIRYQGHSMGIAGALKKLVGERSTTPAEGLAVGGAEGLAVGGAEALSYRIDHLMGHASQRGFRFPIPSLITSFLITTLTIATILAPLPGSHL